MAKIDPERLKALRTAKGWSQEQLAEKTKTHGQPKIDKQTISRLERGAADKTRGRTVEQLARALSVEPTVLTGEAPVPETMVDPLAPKYQFNVRISQATRNALILVACRYAPIEPWQIIELAPFLFCWAAEASLRRRRQMVDEFERGRDALIGLSYDMSHVPMPFEKSTEDEMIAAERTSIDIRDLFGTSIAEDTGFFTDPDTDDPFLAFLRTLAKDAGDDTDFDGWAPDGSPSYLVCIEEAVKLFGGDRALANIVLSGHAALNEMPKEIAGPEKVKERAEWVLTKAIEHEKARSEELEARNKELEASLNKEPSP